MKGNIVLIGVIRIGMVGGAIVVPGLPRLLAEYGISIWEMELYFALAMLCSLVPSGLAADAWGEKPVLIGGGLCILSGSLAYIVADGYLGFLIAELLLGFGLGCIFGCDESLLHRSLSDRGAALRFAALWDRMVILQITAVAISFSLGDLLAAWHQRAPFAASLLSYGAVLVAALLVQQPARDRPVTDWRGMLLALRQSAGLRWSIAAYACLVALLRCAFWGYSDYFILSESPYSLGVVLAAGSLLAAGSAAAARSIRAKLAVHTVVGLGGFGLAGSLLCMGMFVGQWSFLLIFMHQVVRGLTMTVLSTHLHDVVDGAASELRAALASAREMSYLLLYIGMTAVIRWYAEHAGIANVLLLIGGAAILGASLLLAAGSARRTLQG